MTTSHKNLSSFQGSLLVLGTSVGGGMLGLPVMTGTSGFFPSCTMMLASWFFMTLTGIIMAELACRMKHNANLLSLYSKEYPKGGAIASITVYFVLFYSLMVAYILALGRMVSDLSMSYEIAVSIPLATSLIALFFAIVIWAMRSLLSAVNTFLVGLMATAYIIFISGGLDIVHLDRLQRMEWHSAWSSLPLIFTSFGFQGTVPSLAAMMQYDRRKIITSIVAGTGITLLVYLLWQMIILGAIPFEGYMGLQYAQAHGLDAVTPLQYHLSGNVGQYLIVASKLFALSAVATSLIGVSIGMNDFIADTLRIRHKTPLNRLFLSALSFIPALLCSLIYPFAFLNALSVAGGIGCAFLLGLMPSLIARSRHQSGHSQTDGESGLHRSAWQEKLISGSFHRLIINGAIIFFSLEIGYEVYLLIGK